MSEGHQTNIGLQIEIARLKSDCVAIHEEYQRSARDQHNVYLECIDHQNKVAEKLKSELQSAREVIEWYSDGLYPDDVSEIYKIQSMDGIEYQHKEHRVGRRARQWLEQHKQENRK